ncbi:RusA family crossover junction endodeoxyribonuclease [Acinetobacter bereziniae]|uniref:RusA family crossover junction endodeoxyribonuclease n=1 Tax=Acinetobacter bereziniae TaxID=106648 RepID=UPI001901E17C|nr:RusA family crossover junction endodeoxyribonuclease [Acinetobacter bereziniae]MBJ8474369.1 RusA family crossover junction endodeoxyribonuclease [Acinetobacter bereziniae]
MRMTEEQYQNLSLNQKIRGLQRFKKESDARVLDELKEALKREPMRIIAVTENVILECEIATVPPSVNHYWLSSGKKRYLSDRAKAFHRIVKHIVPSHKTIARLKLEVTFHFPDRRTRDIDNYLKATIDSLVKCGLCVDDEQFDELIVKRGNVIKGGLIKLKVCTI